MAKRGNHIQVVVSSAEKERIRAHADKIGMSSSSFLRALGLKAIAEQGHEEEPADACRTKP